MVHLPFLPWCKQILRPAACPSQPGNLKMILAAVICDADDPCSVNTAYDPESSFTVLSRSTTRPLYFWNSSSKLLNLIDRDQLTTQNEQYALSPCFSDHLTFNFRLSSAAMPVFSPIFHCCLCIWYFHGFKHRNNYHPRRNYYNSNSWWITCKC